MFEVFIALGIIISLMYNEITDMSPGGLISPGYFALFMTQPSRIFSTLVMALLIGLVLKVLVKYLPIYGKRQFACAVTLAILFKLLLGDFIMSSVELSVSINSIGVIIPGLIANDIMKQGAFKTVVSLVIVSTALFALLVLLKMFY
jgi:poly-gamma-glutamate biosynthesis protein PgsC/CapC